MQSDMKKKGKSIERKEPKCHGLQMTSLGMMCKGLRLRVCLAGWRNTEELSVARELSEGEGLWAERRPECSQCGNGFHSPKSDPVLGP